jgi:alpha-mannosidase
MATHIHTGSLPGAAAFVRVKPEAFVLSTIKAAEDGSGLIVRGYNIGADTIDVRLSPWQKFVRAARVRLDETKEAELAPSADGSVTFIARGHEIVTIKLQA